MTKVIWKPGTVIYPLPVVMVSCGEKREEYNIITVAWTGTICTEPAMTYVSIRKERFSHDIIKRTGSFVINLITKDLVFATDFCGVKSGRKVDKFAELDLTPVPSETVAAPLIKECPVNIECSVVEIKELGSHDMFLAKVTRVNADKKYINKKGAFQFHKIEPVSYAHGKYYVLGYEVGSFGYSVNKKKHRGRNS